MALTSEQLQKWIDASPENAAAFGQAYTQKVNPTLTTGMNAPLPYSIAAPTYAQQHLDVGTGQSTWTNRDTGELINNYTPGTSVNPGGLLYIPSLDKQGYGDTQESRDAMDAYLRSQNPAMANTNFSYVNKEPQGLLNSPVSNATAQPATTPQATPTNAPVAPQGLTDAQLQKWIDSSPENANAFGQAYQQKQDPLGYALENNMTPQQEKQFAASLLEQARAGTLTPEQSIKLFQQAPSWDGYGRTGQANIAENFYRTIKADPALYESLPPQQKMQYHWLEYQQGDISGNNAQDRIKKVRKEAGLPSETFEGENRLINRYKATEEGRSDGIDPSDVYAIGSYTQSDTGNDGGAFGSALGNIVNPLLPGFNLKDVAEVLEPVTKILDNPVIKYGLMAAGGYGFLQSLATNGLATTLSMAASGELGAEGFASLEYLGKVPMANTAIKAFQEQVNPRPNATKGEPADIGDLNDPNNTVEPSDLLGQITQLPGLPPSEKNGAESTAGSSQASTKPSEIGETNKGSGENTPDNIIEFQMWEAVNNATGGLRDKLIKEYENYSGEKYDPNKPPQANQTEAPGNTNDTTSAPSEGENNGLLGGILGGLWGLGGVGGVGGSGTTGGAGSTAGEGPTGEGTTGTGTENTGTEDNTGTATEGNNMGLIAALLAGLWGLNGSGTFGNNGGNGNGIDTNNNNTPPPVPPPGTNTGDSTVTPYQQNMSTGYQPRQWDTPQQKPLFDVNKGRLQAPMVLPADNAGQDTWEQWLEKYFAQGGTEQGLLTMIAGPTGTKSARGLI